MAGRGSLRRETARSSSPRLWTKILRRGTEGLRGRRHATLTRHDSILQTSGVAPTKG
jgi:hypothetical protein